MSHTPSLEATVRTEGLVVVLRVRAGRLHVDGPFAGNIEVEVRSEPTLPPKVILEALGIRTGGDAEASTAIAYESFSDGRLEVTFHSATAALRDPVPASLALSWAGGKGRKALGDLSLIPVRE